jgi:hypothetical protein
MTSSSRLLLRLYVYRGVEVKMAFKQDAYDNGAFIE